MRYSNESRNGTIFSRSSRVDRQRTILFVTDGDEIPTRLRYAIERDLPWLSVIVVDSVAAIAPSYRDMLALVVLAPAHMADMERHAATILRFHPLALVAVMDDVSPMSRETIRQVQASKIIRGVLPMRAKLDVLTPIISLMTRGGDYYPKYLLEQPARIATVEVSIGTGNSPPNPGTDYLSYLTKRERQVLALVSRGLQNKSIASDLKLSEHTVKIHLHNIITKLGTHNRTEAAAVYRDGGRIAMAEERSALS